MAWRNVSMEQERFQFINEALELKKLKSTFKDLCAKYNISTKTGYKWLTRFYEKGQIGLKDLSRAPLTNRNRICHDTKKAIIEIKKAWPKWGPKKIQPELKMLRPGKRVPSISSIGNVLKGVQLVTPRNYRRHVAQTDPLKECNKPNDVWMYDFKGWFQTGDGKRCEPLTITDGYSRYLIRCFHMDRKRTQDVWRILEDAFYEYGLPYRIRSDNGPPFATTGVGRLSPLAIKLIKAGVTPEWIEPGCPEQNGRHERFHLTLKIEAATPPAATLKLQKVKFEQFERVYNTIRPHESLGQIPPAKVYVPSSRIWDGKLRSPEYADEYDIRKVGSSGNISLHGRDYFLSESLRGEYVGLKELDIGLIGIYFGPIKLGKIDFKKGFQRL